MGDIQAIEVLLEELSIPLPARAAQTRATLDKLSVLDVPMRPMPSTKGLADIIRGQVSRDEDCDPVALARRDPKRIRHVHLKDVSRERYEHALARGLDFTAAVGEDVFVPVGEGAVDMKGVIGTLRDVGFDGWLIVEQDIRIAPGSSRRPRVDAAKSHAFITARLR